MTGTYFCRAALLALLGITLFYFAETLRADWVRLTSHYIFSGVEPQPVYGSMRVVSGVPLYENYLTHTPHVPLAYGPLCYWIPGWIARVMGQTNALDVLRLGRFFTLICMVGAFITIALLSQRPRTAKAIVLAAPLSLVWFPYITEWNVRFSPDAPALFCSLAGWIFARRGALQTSRRAYTWMIGAGILWSLGFFFKPTILAGQIAFLVELFAGKRRFGDRLRTSLLSLGTYGVVSISVALILNWHTAGLWRMNQIDANTVSSTSISFIRESLLNFRGTGMLSLAALVLFAAFHWKREPLFIAFFLSLGFDLTLMTKQGSNVNYLIGSLAIWAVGTSGILQKAWALDGDDGVLRPRFVTPWAALLTILLLLGSNRAGVIAREVRVPSRQEIEKIDQAVTSFPANRVLGLEPFYGMLRGLPILYSDGYHAALLSSAGRISLTAEAERIRRGDYHAIVANRLLISKVRWHGAPFVDQELREAIETNYEPALSGSWLVLWLPKSRM